MKPEYPRRSKLECISEAVASIVLGLPILGYFGYIIVSGWIDTFTVTHKPHGELLDNWFIGSLVMGFFALVSLAMVAVCVIGIIVAVQNAYEIVKECLEDDAKEK